MDLISLSFELVLEIILSLLVKSFSTESALINSDMIVAINRVQLLLIVILDALFVQFLAALQFHRYVEGVLQSLDFPLPDEGVVV